jgi:hypothetical protein
LSGGVIFAGLLSFTLSLAILPQGFMHTSLGSGAPFALCPSDPASNTWLQLAAHEENSNALMHVMVRESHMLMSEGHHSSHDDGAVDTLSCEITSTLKYFILALSVVSTLPTRIPSIKGVDFQTILKRSQWVRPLVRSPPFLHPSSHQTS